MVASDIVTGALTVLGILATGDTPTSDEAAQGLLVLQQLLDSWSVDELLVFATVTNAITTAASTSSYTLGTRPVKILSADYTISTINTPVKVMGAEEWAALPSKTDSSAQVKAIYCDYAFPTIAVHTAPVPNSIGVLNVYCMVDLAALATGSTAFSMPEGYWMAIEYNLAVALCAMFGKACPPEVAQVAMESKGRLQRLTASDKAGKSMLEVPPVPTK